MATLPFESGVCAAFGLGEPVSPTTPTTGGLTHRMWRLETKNGSFAVKEMALDEDGPWTRPRIERAFTLEMAALEVGLPLPPPLPGVDGGCLADVARDDGSMASVRVHRWVDGTPLQRAVYGVETAREIGGIIARIHALKLRADALPGDALAVRGEAHWRSLSESVERSRAPWKWEYRAILPALVEIESYVVSAQTDPTPLIMSHRDADQKNWMRTAEGSLVLVDWDAAGPVNARHEVASLALTWAGAHLGEPDWKVVRGWLEGYRDGGGSSDPIRDGDLAEFLHVLVGWFEFNTQRAIGELPASEDEQARASDIVRRMFRELPRYMRNAERWTNLLAAE